MSFEKLIKDLAAPKETGKYASMSFADMDRIAPYIVKVAAGELEGMVGSSQEPDFPDAAKGTENAGRPATASELRVQNTIPTDSGSRVVTDKVAEEKTALISTEKAERKAQKWEAKLDKYITKKDLTPERASAILRAGPNRAKAYWGGIFGQFHDQKVRAAAQRVLDKHEKKAAVKTAVSTGWVKRLSSSGAKKRTVDEMRAFTAASGHNPELVAAKAPRIRAEKALKEQEGEAAAASTRASKFFQRPSSRVKEFQSAVTHHGRANKRREQLASISEGIDRARAQVRGEKKSNFDPDFAPGSSADTLPEYAALPASQKYRRQIGGGVGGIGGAAAGGVAGVELARRYGASPLVQALGGIAGGTLGGVAGRAGGQALANMSQDPQAKQVLEAQGAADSAYAAQDAAASQINSAMSGLPAARDTRDRLIQRMRMMQAQGAMPQEMQAPAQVPQEM